MCKISDSGNTGKFVLYFHHAILNKGSYFYDIERNRRAAAQNAPDRTNMTAVRGCYVSASGEILSTFRESVALMSQEDKESYLSIFRRVLSGVQDKNIIDLSFKTSQVADSDEHRLLMALRDSGLDDEQALETFYQTVTSALTSEDHYLILLAHERYDVPFKAKDGAHLEDGSEVFSYVLCAICPVKPGKAALRYNAEEKEFHNQGGRTPSARPNSVFSSRPLTAGGRSL